MAKYLSTQKRSIPAYAPDIATQIVTNRRVKAILWTFVTLITGLLVLAVITARLL